MHLIVALTCQPHSLPPVFRLPPPTRSLPGRCEQHVRLFSRTDFRVPTLPDYRALPRSSIVLLFFTPSSVPTSFPGDSTTCVCLVKNKDSVLDYCCCFVVPLLGPYVARKNIVAFWGINLWISDYGMCYFTHLRIGWMVTQLTSWSHVLQWQGQKCKTLFLIFQNYGCMLSKLIFSFYNPHECASRVVSDKVSKKYSLLNCTWLLAPWWHKHTKTASV